VVLTASTAKLPHPQPISRTWSSPVIPALRIIACSCSSGLLEGVALAQVAGAGIGHGRVEEDLEELVAEVVMGDDVFPASQDRVLRDGVENPVQPVKEGLEALVAAEEGSQLRMNHASAIVRSGASHSASM